MNLTSGQLLTIEDMKEFCLAGNATFTLRSKKTGTRFTYKVTEEKKKETETKIGYWVKYMFGTDNERDFRYMGYLVKSMAGWRYVHGKYPTKSCQHDTAKSTLAIRWFFAMLEAGKLSEELEVWHEGRCGRCGRKLTVPESIANGIGPECIKHRKPSQLKLVG